MLYRMLADKVYIGKITYKDRIYDGQHEPLVSEELFNKVQKLLRLHSQERKYSTNAKDGSLLTGLIYDDMGNRMTPSHGNKKGKRYRRHYLEIQGVLQSLNMMKKQKSHILF